MDTQIKKLIECNAHKDRQIAHKDTQIEKLEACCANKDRQISTMVGAIKDQKLQVSETIRKMSVGKEEILNEVRNIKLSIRPAIPVPASVKPTSDAQKNPPPAAAPVDPPATQVPAPATTIPRTHANPLPPSGHGEPSHHNKGGGTSIPPLLSLAQGTAIVQPPNPQHGPTVGQSSVPPQPHHPRVPERASSNHPPEQTHCINKETITPSQRKVNRTVLVIADSNGKHLDPQLRP